MGYDARYNPPKWKDFTEEQKQLIRELRKDGWSMWDAWVQAACCG